MDPPLNESSFSAANPSSYTLSEIWPFPASDGLRSGLRLSVNSGGLADFSGNKDISAEESTVTEHSGGCGARRRRDLSSEDESSKMVSSSSSGNGLNELSEKKSKISGSESENEDGARPEGETSSGGGSKGAEKRSKPEPSKDYIHVRARRGQATDRHSLAERARREKISERMKVLQDLVPGCAKIIGKALVLDEIINYIQSLQRQVEFLSMKLEVVNSGMGVGTTIFPSGDHSFQKTICDQRDTIEARGLQPEWLNMQPDGRLNFD